jgi:hypothetical protein
MGRQSLHCFFFFFAEVGKILFAESLVGEKRRERLHIGECRGTQKPVIPAYFIYLFIYLFFCGAGVLNSRPTP